jgi:hypothetical protein
MWQKQPQRAKNPISKRKQTRIMGLAAACLPLRVVLGDFSPFQAFFRNIFSHSETLETKVKAEIDRQLLRPIPVNELPRWHTGL